MSAILPQQVTATGARKMQFSSDMSTKSVYMKMRAQSILSSIEDLRDELKAQQDQSKAQKQGYEERLPGIPNQQNTQQPVCEVAVAIRRSFYNDFADSRYRYPRIGDIQ